MFPHFEQTSPFPSSMNQTAQFSHQREGKSQQLRNAYSREGREQKLSRMRLMNTKHFLNYEGINFNKFAPVVDNETNPYTVLVTIFTIVDNFTWRQYLCHLQVLIKKFTNFVEASKGKILDEISSRDSWMEKLGGFNFQERLETMLHLSNKEFQEHLLILIHTLIAYNKRYCLLDETLLSDHLTHRQPYQKFIRQDILWLLTRMSLSCDAVNKVIKSYLSSVEVSPLLPVLTIMANFIYQQPESIVLQFVALPEVQSIIERGLMSNHFQSQREAAFICNNIIFKSQNCYYFLGSQVNLIRQVQNLKNEQAVIFCSVMEKNRGLKTEKMEQEYTL